MFAGSAGTINDELELKDIPKWDLMNHMVFIDRQEVTLFVQLSGEVEKSLEDLATINDNFDSFFLNSLDLTSGEQAAPFDRNTDIRSCQPCDEKLISYFTHRKNKLLVTNFADPQSNEIPADFLNRDIQDILIPHLNSFQ